MDIGQLYDFLEMDGPEDLEYFEQFADLMEYEADIDFDTLNTVFSAVTPDVAGELVENYFDELTEALPDEENDLISIVDSIGQNLMLLAEDLDKDRVRDEFVHRIESFRSWFHKPGGAEVDGESCSLFAASVLYREDRLGGDFRRYSFAGSLDYKLEDAGMILGGFEKIDV